MGPTLMRRMECRHTMEHHIFFTVWIKKTSSERVTDTVFFKQKYLTNTEVTPEDKVVAAAQILTHSMKGNLTGESEEMEALEKVADIFETVAKLKAREQKNNTIMSMQFDFQEAPMHNLQGWPNIMRNLQGWKNLLQGWT